MAKGKTVKKTGKKMPDSKKKNVVKVQKKGKIPMMTKMEGQYFQELVNANNRYEAITKQKTQYEFAIKQMEEDRKKVQKGELVGPFQLTIIPKVLSRTVTDKKEILELFDKQLKTYKEMVKSLNGQVEHRYEEYIEVASRTLQYMEKKFGDSKVKHIAPDRRTAKKEEETLFEAEFEDLAKDPELKKEFEKKKKEAIKKNVARKTKQSK